MCISLYQGTRGNAFYFILLLTVLFLIYVIISNLILKSFAHITSSIIALLCISEYFTRLSLLYYIFTLNYSLNIYIISINLLAILLNYFIYFLFYSVFEKHY